MKIIVSLIHPILPFLPLLLLPACRRDAPPPPETDTPRESSPPAAIVQPGHAVYHADYRKVSGHDPGSLRLFIRSGPDSPPIREVILNGSPIPVWGLTNILTGPVAAADSAPADDIPFPFDDIAPSDDAHGHTEPSYLDRLEHHSHKRIIWARLRQPESSSAGIAELVVKLTNPLSIPARLAIRDAGGSETAAVIRPRPPSHAITAIRFDPDMTTAYCHVRGPDSGDGRIEIIEVDGVPVPADQWREGSPLPGSAQRLVAISPATGFQTGRAYTFRLGSPDGAAAVECVRALAFFPAGSEWGDINLPDLDVNLQSVTASRKQEFESTNELESEPLEYPDHPHISYIFDCGMHAYGARLTRSAQHAFRTHERWSARVPHAPTTIHMCRIRPEEGYALFGEVADTLRYQPLFSNRAEIPAGGPDPVATAVRLTGEAVTAAAPRPAQVVLPLTFGRNHPDMSPPDVRRLALAMIGRGAGGLIFRESSWDAAHPAHAEAVAMLRTARSAMPYLRTAAFVDASSRTYREGEIAVYRLRAGLQSGLLILVAGADAGDGPAELDPGLIPPDATIQQAGPDGLSPVEPSPAGAGSLHLPVTDGASLFVITWTESQSYERGE